MSDGYIHQPGGRKELEASSTEQLRRFLGGGRTQNASYLARQPVIGLLPDELFNVSIWRPEESVNQHADSSADLEAQYRDMASDATHEREAEEWIEGLVGDAFAKG
jgi:hypothetical protein